MQHSAATCFQSPLTLARGTRDRQARALVLDMRGVTYCEPYEREREGVRERREGIQREERDVGEPSQPHSARHVT